MSADRTASSSPITRRLKVAGLAVKGERSESRSDTEGALDGQNGDLTIKQAGRTKLPSHETLGRYRMEQIRLETVSTTTGDGDGGQVEEPLPLLLTMDQAAARLGIGRTKLYELVMAGVVESVHVGRLRRIPAECLDECVARLRAGSGPGTPAA